MSMDLERLPAKDPSREARYFRKFVEETDPDVRQRILDVVPDETSQALEAQWIRQQKQIQSAKKGTPDTSEGRPYTEEDVEEYQHAKTGLTLGNYLRSRQIARFFFTRKFNLPEDQGRKRTIRTWTRSLPGRRT